MTTPEPSLSDRAFILASRSPRRFDLLASLVPQERIRAVPPASADEAGFDALRTRCEIEARLRSIAATKYDDVRAQLRDAARDAVIIAADTVIVVGNRDGELHVLGQPPEPEWRETTRRWFVEHYAGRTHSVLTALCVAYNDDRRDTVVESRVTIQPDVARHLDWYLASEEPRGKAGGYAIQGLGSLFVDRLEGSLTNVIGLPLRELLDLLRSLRHPAS